MAEYRNPWQWNDQAVEWSTDLPRQSPWGVTFEQVNPGYISGLLSLRARVQSGQATPEERQEYARQEAAARAIPMRDPSTLQFGWNNDEVGSWNEGGSDWWQMLNGSSPDLGPVMLSIADRIAQGTATEQERQLLQQTIAYDRDWDYRASVPQASDAFNPLGDQFFGALGTLALGATGGLAAAPLAAGGASLASTLGSLGTLSGIAGTGAGVLGQATDQDWLSQAGLALGALGGVAGGAGGLAHLWGTGVQSLSDAARLASSAGRITGAVGRASGVAPLQQAASYLGQAGQLGQIGSGVLPTSVTDWSTQRGGPMDWNEWERTDWLDWSGGGQGPLLTDAGPGIDWGSFTSGGPGSWAGQMFTDYGNGTTGGSSGGTGWLSSVLGGLGQAGRFLGSNASWLGPAASTIGSLAGGAIGSNASSDAARLQADALNRGLDLATAQWLTQQQNLAPWMQAGQEALGHMTGRMAWQGPQQPGATPAVSGANYGLPSATPGWTPQAYQGPAGVDANAYRYTPGQVPSAAQYRYQPGQIPNAGQFRYTPGAVPTLQGRELLANDPGYQFRQDEARRALEASALARGSGMSGSTLAALQRQSSDLASNEYANAWQRASQQAQMREQWGQTASQMGFGQAMSEAQFREQAAQIASQQGFSQAQAEAALREQLAQQSSQQGFSQALAAQGQQWQQGFAGEQWTQKQQQDYANQLYQNLFQQSQTQYGRDVYSNEADYQRQQQAYQQQIAELQRQWGQFAQVAGMGQGATNQFGAGGQANAQQQASLLGQIGNAQAGGSLGASQAWLSSLGNFQNSLQGTLQNQSLLSALSNLNR